MSAKSLFEDDKSESVCEDEVSFKINKKYADRYGEWRKGEELQKFKDRYGTDDLSDYEESETSDDEFVEPDNPEFDRDFLLALGALHQKDLSKVNQEKFFKESYATDNKKEQIEKPMTLKDYERHIILERHGKLEDDEDDMSVRSRNESHFLGDKKCLEINDDGSDNESDDGLLSSGLFKVKYIAPKTEEVPDSNSSKDEKTKIAEELWAFVKGKKNHVNNVEEKTLLSGLREAWNSPSISKDDKFLTDFFINKRYLDEEDESIKRAYNEVVIDEESISEDEKTLETMEEFETKHRFRYEEPDQEFIKHYPRAIPDSLRLKDDKRKLKREEIKKRKEEDMNRKRQEINQLKALKYKEIEEKIKQIKEISGNDDIDLGKADLEEDFDPEAHEKVMEKMFGGNYYEKSEDNDEKPVFSDDDDDVIKDYDDWLNKEGGKIEEDGAKDEYHDYEDFKMNADYNPNLDKKAHENEMIKASSRRKGKKKSKFAKALARKKPVFNPNEKNFDSYYEEYYNLDFEDIVGGMPCRFKYRKVEPNNFGLATEDILRAKDKELNRWFSLKKIMRYDRDEAQELRDRNNYMHRATQLHVMQKFLPTLFTEEPEPEETFIDEDEKRRLKNLKKKLRKQKKVTQIEQVCGTETNETPLIVTASENNSLLVNELPSTSNPSPDKKARLEVNQEMCDIEDNSVTSINHKMKKKKNKKRKLKNNNSDVTSSTNNTNNMTLTNKVISSPVLDNSLANAANPKKRKNKPKSNSNLISKKLMRNANNNPSLGLVAGISDVRLLAYGEKPKKIKQKMKYGVNKGDNP